MSRIEPTNIYIGGWSQDMTFDEFCAHCATYGFPSVGIDEDEYEELWGMSTDSKWSFICDINAGLNWNTAFYAAINAPLPLILPSSQAEIQEFAR